MWTCPSHRDFYFVRVWKVPSRGPYPHLSEENLLIWDVNVDVEAQTVM